MGNNIVELAAIQSEKKINHDAIELVEGLLERLKSGESIGVAIVEAKSDNGKVATAWSDGGEYHLINSGCATLFARIAG